MGVDGHGQNFKILEENCDTQFIVKENHEENSEHEKKFKLSTSKLDQFCHGFTKRFSKPLYIIIGLVITILLLITIVTISLKKSNAAVPINSSSSMVIISNNRNIWSINLKSMTYNVVVQAKNVISAFDIYMNKTMIWSEENLKTINTLSNDPLNITYPEKWTVHSIAVDFITEKLYVIDKLAGTLNIVDMRYKHYGIVLSDLLNPHDVVLDAMHGLMFVLQLSHSIMRANMDGKSTTLIVTDNRISAIAINCKSREIFWANSGENIMSSNYEGQNRATRTKVSLKVSSLAVTDNQLFWLISSHVSNNSIIFSCDIEKEICGDDYSMHAIPLESEIISTYPEQHVNSLKSPCDRDNGKCEHMCVLTVNGGHSCACKIGWELISDLQHCTRVDEYLVYSQGNFFVGRSLNVEKEAFVDVISPTPFVVESLKGKETIDFDKSWLPNEVFFNDDKNIYKLNLTEGKQTKVFQIEDGYRMENLAIDWYSKNLYYLKISEKTNNHSVEVIRFKENKVFRKTINSFSYDNNTLGFATQSLEVDPHFGRLWFTYKTNQYITEMFLNGNEPRSSQSWTTFYSANANMIFTFDYENSNAFYTFQELIIVREPKKMCIHRQMEYVSDRKSIWRFDKHSGNEQTKIVPKFQVDRGEKISGVKVINLLNDYPVNIGNNCEIDNGGCEIFCFGKPEKTCDCPDSSKIIADGRCS